MLLTACRPAQPPVATLTSPAEIQHQIVNTGARLTLVHVWATWCDPCREEFPEIVATYNTFKDRDVELLLISADNPEDLDAVNAFLAEQQAPVGSMVSTALDETFMTLLSTNWSGALPASFFYDANGQLVAEWSGKRSFEEYAGTIEQLLKP